MTIMELGALGEFVGSIGVIATLIYLAVQVHQNTTQMRFGGELSRLLLHENFASGQQGFFHSLLENEESFRVWMLGSSTSEELTSDDREKFGILLFAQMYRYEMMYQAREIEPIAQRKAIVQIDRLAKMRAFQSWWSRQQEAFVFDEGFVEMVNQRLGVV